MDAKANLHLVLCHALLAFLGARQRATAEGHAEGADTLGYGRGLGLHLVQGQAGGGSGAGGLQHEERAPEAAGLFRIGDRHIIADDDQLHIQAVLVLRASRGDAEAKAVAGVVHRDEDAACGARRGDDGGKHGVLRGRSEDIAADRCGEEALGDKPRKRGLVAGPAATYNRDLAGVLVPIGTDHDLDIGVAVQARDVGRRHHKAINGLRDDGGRVVDEPLRHDSIQK
mmetsp:Transcript_94705/g.273850  ORF Transcript_94705/g.273850 Transcript_94705/m.273850 type:complete len:227 (-) Transcript_94705:72-752(-)